MERVCILCGEHDDDTDYRITDIGVVCYYCAESLDGGLLGCEGSEVGGGMDAE